MDKLVKTFRDHVANACAAVGAVPFSVEVQVETVEWDRCDAAHRARWFADVAAATCQALCRCAATASTDPTTRLVRVIGYDPTT